MDLIAHLKTLCATPGMSGHERPIRDVIAAAWGDLSDELHTDALGSLTAIKRGRGRKPRPRIMLSAHMDNIGFMVASVRGERAWHSGGSFGCDPCGGG